MVELRVMRGCGLHGRTDAESGALIHFTRNVPMHPIAEGRHRALTNALTAHWQLARSRCLLHFAPSSVLACWLWLIALAASPSLHDWVHHDDPGGHEHVCLATLLATGSCDAPADPEASVEARAPAVVGSVVAVEEEAHALFVNGRPLERGPPGGAV